MSEDKEEVPGTQERLAALGRVMGELVHDLNNEVTVLQGWAMLARGELEAGRHPANEVERVVAITDVIGQMLRDMLDTIAERSLSPEVTFSPLALAEETLADRVRGLGSVMLRLDCSLSTEVRISGRASFWVRIISNLVSNATRYARARISVTLAPGLGAGGEPAVVLRVEDDGPGIPTSDLPTVFQPFWHGASGGMGLGLSSASWAVAQLRGSIAYRDDSSLGGAAFEVRVPVAVRLVSRPPPEGSALTELETIRGARIVIVDDDAAVRHAMRRLLQRSGVDVRELDPEGEPEAHVLRSILSSLPDAVILDLRLGERGGVSLWSRMCMEMPQLASRVIFVSGASPGEADWEQARLTGQPLLGKPFDLRELARIILRLRAGQ